MQVFHWNRQNSNYAFLESRDQCLHGLLGPVTSSRPGGEIFIQPLLTLVSNPNFSPRTTGLSVNGLSVTLPIFLVDQIGLSVTSVQRVPNMDFQTVCDDSPIMREVLQYSQ